jgi:hypothetical protein
MKILFSIIFSLIANVGFAHNKNIYVCYALDGQTVVLNDGSVRDASTSAFRVVITEKTFNMEAIKGQGYQEVLQLSDVQIFPVYPNTVLNGSKLGRTDFIANIKTRNFILECERD